MRTQDGKIIPCYRHSDGFAAIKNYGYAKPSDPIDQGFLTSENRYVDRQEGRKIFDAAGQQSPDKRYDYADELYSENLY